MTLVKVLLVIWGVSLAASWLMYGKEARDWKDKLLLSLATGAGLVALVLAVVS